MPPPKSPFENKAYGPPLTPTPSGNAGLYQEGDDIPKGLPPPPGSQPETRPVTRKKLGDYLSNITQVNKYKISGNTEDGPLHNDPGGSPPVLDANKNKAGASNTFIEEILKAGAVTKSDFSLIGTGEYKNPKIESGELNPFIADSDGNVSAIYAKGVGHSRGEGHSLLANIPGNGVVWTSAGDDKGIPAPPAENNKILQKTDVILKNNRFHPFEGSPYVKNGSFSAGGGKGAMGSVQTVMGRYDSGGASISVSDLQDVGRRIMLKAVGTPGEGQLAPILPSLQQIGLPYVSISMDDLSPVNAFKEASESNKYKDLKTNSGYILSSNGLKSAELTTSGVRNELSSGDTYGNLNSYFEKFSGLAPLGMVTAAIGSALAILIQAAVLIAIFALVALARALTGSKPVVPEYDPKDPRTLEFGKKRPEGELDLLKLWLGLPTLLAGEGDTYWFECVLRGLGTFFGVDNLTSAAGIGDLVENLLLDPSQAGYAATIFRVINRDLESLVNAGRPLTTEIARDRESVTNKISAALAVVVEFGRIKSVRFLNLCAQIGDILNLSNGEYQNSKSGIQKKYRDIDALPNEPKYRLIKSRVGVEGRGDAMLRHGSLPSLYLIPPSLGIAHTQFFDGKKSLSLNLPKNWETPADAKGRIDEGTVRKIEDLLEAEYVPFYFQDLRTNEIIAFHAFIDSLTDDYSPEWNSVSGYGRMDPVQIYNKTSRSVSITFFVAATDPEDFDLMWFNINKLVTLIYPQYSPGSAVRVPTTDKGHIMPFSQVPAASPIIRMRVGDLMKSNYSRFNLARIFGVGIKNSSNSAFHVVSEESKVKEEKAKTKVEVYNDIVNTEPKKASEPYGYPIDAIIRVKVNNPFRIYQGDNSLLFVDGVDSARGGPGVSVDLLAGQKLKVISREDAAAGTKKQLSGKKPRREWVSYIASVEGGENAGVEILISHKEVLVDEAWISSYIAPPPPGTSPEQPPALGSFGDFFNPEKNAVVRTFESSYGRGLAGAITAFNLDYADSPWNVDSLRISPSDKENISEGYGIAPMWVKVSITMAVIHDIPPGLDSDGLNRAPIYPVGQKIQSLINSSDSRKNSSETDDSTGSPSTGIGL